MFRYLLVSQALDYSHNLGFENFSELDKNDPKGTTIRKYGDCEFSLVRKMENLELYTAVCKMIIPSNVKTVDFLILYIDTYNLQASSDVIFNFAYPIQPFYSSEEDFNIEELSSKIEDEIRIVKELRDLSLNYRENDLIEKLKEVKESNKTLEILNYKLPFTNLEIKGWTFAHFDIEFYGEEEYSEEEADNNYGAPIVNKPNLDSDDLVI